MNNRMVKEYLAHSAGPKIDDWGKVGTEAFKQAKHDYNVGYYQRNKILWDKSKQRSKNKLSEMADTVETMNSVYSDMDRVQKDQYKNAMELRRKDRENGGRSEIKEYIDQGIYQLKTVVNKVKYNYLDSVAAGASSLTGYKVLKTITSSIDTLKTKVSDLWSSGMQSIAKLFS